MPHRNPHCDRDYFRKLGEIRREYLRRKYRENPSRQAEASRRYHAKPGVKERIREAARKRRQNPKVKARIREYQRKEAARLALYRLNKILRKHGVTIEWYQQTFDAQSGRCAICRRDDPGCSRFKRLHIDHCHHTGKVRGLLCNSCNRGIGWLGDNPAVLIAAAQYLTQHQQIPEIS